MPSEAPLTERGENLDLFPARQGNRLSVIEAADRAGALISGQVRSVIEAAELHARTICEEAERDAREIVADAGRDAQRLGERVDAVAGPLATLLEDLRRQSDRLTIQMAAHDMLRGRPFEIDAAAVEEELDPDSVEDPPGDADSDESASAAHYQVAAAPPDHRRETTSEAPRDMGSASPARGDRSEVGSSRATVHEREPARREAPVEEEGPSTRPCPSCGTYGRCQKCGGRGRRFALKCKDCGGSGICSTCRGPGYIWVY